MKIVKLSAILVLLVVIVSSCSFGNKDTCEICGYMALKGPKCMYCSYVVWNSNMDAEEDDYIRALQVEWFYVPGMEIDFYNPKVVTDFIDETTYTKDSLWQPKVTVAEVNAASKKLQ